MYEPINTSDFPRGSVGKESACNVGDQASIPGSRRSHGEENEGNPLQHSCLGNPRDRGAGQATYDSRGHKRGGHNLVTKQQQIKCMGLLKAAPATN